MKIDRLVKTTQELTRLMRGVQVVYKRPGAKPEYGFITSMMMAGDGAVLPTCRFWRQDDLTRLRTIANSETVPITMLQRYGSVSWRQVEEALWQIDNPTGDDLE